MTSRPVHEHASLILQPRVNNSARAANEAVQQLDLRACKALATTMARNFRNADEVVTREPIAEGSDDDLGISDEEEDDYFWFDSGITIMIIITKK